VLNESQSLSSKKVRFGYSKVIFSALISDRSTSCPLHELLSPEQVSVVCPVVINNAARMSILLLIIGFV
jgi:hypothetical protein